MTVQQMRELISKAYHSMPWQEKVAKMSDSQIIAVYNRFKDQKKI